MKLQLSKLQENNEEIKVFRGFASLPEDWKDVKGVLSTEASHTSQNSSILSQLASTIMTLLQTILELIKLESWSVRNTIDQVREKTLNPMWKNVTFVWL